MTTVECNRVKHVSSAADEGSSVFSGAAACLSWVSVALMCAFLGGCGPETVAPLSEETIEERDPEADLLVNLSRGDLSLVGVETLGLEIPGTAGCPSELAEELGVRAISWTSDYARSQQEARLNEAAWDYAKTYNSSLISHIITRGDGRVVQLARECESQARIRED